jgi:hypothetical protein
VGLLTTALLLSSLNEARTNRATMEIHAAERTGVYERRDRRATIGASRSRWLFDHDAEGSFPCGVVRPAQEGEDDPALAALRGMDLELPVTAALLPDAVAFLAEPPESSGVDEVLEVGRIPRAALGQADVVDANGAHVPEPFREAFEPETDVWLMLRWGSGSEADEERFLFRSTWLAWEAARRLRGAAGPPG